MKILFNVGYLFSYVISGGGDIIPSRPVNQDCETCLARQRYGENIACPYDCNQLFDPPCELCPPDPPCPPPGPDCRYEKETDNCGCSYGCGNIVCNPGFHYPPSPPPSSCPIEQIDCVNEFVCPKITEITHCTQGGIEGHTTYQLSLVVQPNKYIENIYAIFGDTYNHVMYLPPAYQIEGPFDSNIGGVSTSIIGIFPDAFYDSWMTIGITDGDNDNKISTIGIDFDEWTETNPITTSNGAVFSLDPNEGGSKDEYIIGQITIRNELIDVLTVNVQGKKSNGDSWKEYDVNFILNPSELIQNSIPRECAIWYDGCNLCHVNNGIIRTCTKDMCFTEGEPECRVRTDELSGH